MTGSRRRRQRNPPCLPRPVRTRPPARIGSVAAPVRGSAEAAGARRRAKRRRAVLLAPMALRSPLAPPARPILMPSSCDRSTLNCCGQGAASGSQARLGLRAQPRYISVAPPCTSASSPTRKPPPATHAPPQRQKQRRYAAHSALDNTMQRPGCPGSSAAPRSSSSPPAAGGSGGGAAPAAAASGRQQQQQQRARPPGGHGSGQGAEGQADTVQQDDEGQGGA